MKIENILKNIENLMHLIDISDEMFINSCAHE